MPGDVLCRASRIRRLILSSIGIVLAACRASDDESYSIQRLALDTLFNGREHPRELVIWSGDSTGPALEATLLGATSSPTRIDIERLRPTVRATTIDEKALTELFRDHADAWAEFFQRYPQSAGLVELAPVRFSSGNRVADTYIGRSCGEHCRNAWHVTARRDSAGAWKVVDLRWLKVPGT
jgi:hypothetical protein